MVLLFMATSEGMMDDAQRWRQPWLRRLCKAATSSRGDTSDRLGAWAVSVHHLTNEYGRSTDVRVSAGQAPIQGVDEESGGGADTIRSGGCHSFAASTGIGQLPSESEASVNFPSSPPLLETNSLKVR